MKRSIRKGCKIFDVHIIDNKEESNQMNVGDIPILRDLQDVFPEEVPGLPPKQEIDFNIDLVPGAIPVSKAPYRMNILELNELKLQLQELIDKKYI